LSALSSWGKSYKFTICTSRARIKVNRTSYTSRTVRSLRTFSSKCQSSLITQISRSTWNTSRHSFIRIISSNWTSYLISSAIAVISLRAFSTSCAIQRCRRSSSSNTIIASSTRRSSCWDISSYSSIRTVFLSRTVDTITQHCLSSQRLVSSRWASDLV